MRSRDAQEAAQRRYYTETAAEYTMQVDAPDEHWRALRQIGHVTEDLGLQSLLDVGTGDW